MEFVLKKEPKWIDFIYDNNIADLLIGENFRIRYSEQSETVQITIDCSCNINEKQQTNNKLDAMDFIHTYSDRLVMLKLNEKNIAAYLIQLPKDKKYKTELVVIFDKEYSYLVDVNTYDNGKICIEVCR